MEHSVVKQRKTRPVEHSGVKQQRPVDDGRPLEQLSRVKTMEHEQSTAEPTKRRKHYDDQGSPATNTNRLGQPVGQELATIETRRTVREQYRTTTVVNDGTTTVVNEEPRKHERWLDGE